MASEFPRILIGDLIDRGDARLQTGPFGSQLHKHDYVDQGVPIIPTEGIGRGRILSDGPLPMISREKAEALARHRLMLGDILFARRGIQATGLSAYVDAQHVGSICGTGALLLRVSPEVLDPKFLSACLSTTEAFDWLRSNAVGAVMPNLNTSIISRLEVPVPPKAVQVALGNFISSLDDRIDLLRQTNATLEAIGQALFKSWFVDFDPVRAKAEGREPEGIDAATAALFPSEFEESELGLIPRGWQICQVGEVAAIVRGRSYKSSELAESDTALVTLKSFNRGGGFRRDGFKPYTGPFKPEQEVFEGDCIVAHTDVTQQAELIGRSALVTRSPRHSRLVASLDVGVVRANSGEMSSVFLCALLSGDRYVSHIKGYTSGTTVLHLSKEGLPGFRFACPPRKLVEAFSELALAIFRRQATNIASQETLADLRDTLLPRLISGKLRLPDAELQLEDVRA